MLKTKCRKSVGKCRNDFIVLYKSILKIMSQTIWAQKGNSKKKFDVNAWKLLKSKNGWVEIETPETPVVQVVKTAPDPGQKKVKAEQVVTNTAKIETPETPVVVKANAPEGEASAEGAADSAEALAPVKDSEFVAFVKDSISKSAIKNYLDGKPELKYKNSMTHTELAGILEESFNSDIEALKVAFAITGSASNASNDGGL